MIEQWQPLGPIGIITAFNFPVAVWAWNAMIAAVCGDTMIWKPSPLTPLTAIAVQEIVNDVAQSNGCEGVFNLCIGGAEDIGERMMHDQRLPLISATGSCRMGRRVGEVVGRRLGRALLELGGNNAIIITPSAELELAIRATAFAAVGTAGQRCTTVRRLIVHESIHDTVLERLIEVYSRVKIGDPWDESVLMGPLINERAVEAMMAAVASGAAARGRDRLRRQTAGPAGLLRRAGPGQGPARHADRRRGDIRPDLYVMKYKTLDEAIAIQNAVEQGLTSAIFTNDLREAEQFPLARRLGLRDRQRQYRHIRGRDRRCVRRRKGHRRRPRGRLGLRGKPTCAGKPAPSITATSCRWLRGCGSIFDGDVADDPHRSATRSDSIVSSREPPGACSSPHREDVWLKHGQPPDRLDV